MNRLTIPRGCIAAATALVLFGCGEKIEPGQTADRTSDVFKAPVAEVASVHRSEPYEAVGTVVAKVYADLSGKLLGTVEEVRAQEGDSVKRGEVLVTLDDRQVNAGMLQAQAALDEARRGEASAASARDMARAAADLAEATYKRFQRLLKEASVTRQEFDEVEARQRQAQAAFTQAEAMVSGARYRVRQAEAALEAATAIRNDSRIRAPYDGRITRKHVHAGDLASPGTPLVTIEKEGGYCVELVLPERYMQNIRLKQVVSVRIPTLGQTPMEGAIGRITPRADDRSRSFQIQVELPEHPGLRSGMFARVQFPINLRRGLMLPKKALLYEGQLVGIFILDDADTARFRLVRTGKEMGDTVEILSGLRAGMRYVTDPPPGLEDGMKVERRP